MKKSCRSTHFCVFFFNDTATTEIYTLSLHDALPIYRARSSRRGHHEHHAGERDGTHEGDRHPQIDRRPQPRHPPAIDRKSTRLNSSHANISYAVFCLKKKKK